MLLRANSGALAVLCAGCLVPSGYPFAETGAGSIESSGAPDTGSSSGSTGGADSDDAGAPTSTAAGLCGDGVVDVGEGCDRGADNSDAGVCLKNCRDARCGDGRLYVGVEACDRGPGNVESGECLPDCTQARCGDGHVQAGVEGCDMGDENGVGYGECDPETCQPGTFCGDGVIQADHEICDPGADTGRAALACEADCRYAGRIVFISAGAFDGDLGSVSDADRKCQVMAAVFDSEKATSYRAWISDDISSPATRFAHGPQFDGVPYVLRNGVRVAASFDDLLDAGVENPITLTETGETLTEVMVWTNTSFEGLPVSSDNHCESWKTDDFTATARFGSNSPPPGGLEAWQTDRHWTTRDDSLCSKQLHLYCFEQ